MLCTYHIILISELGNWDKRIFIIHSQWYKSVYTHTHTYICCLVAKLCQILCYPMDCNSPCPSVYGIFQARILEWVAISFSRGPSWFRDWSCVSWPSALAGGFFPTEPPGKPMFQFSSVAQSCPTLCDPRDCSTLGFPVHDQLPELTQIHVHWVGDAIQPSHPLSSPSPPALNLSQHQGLFKWVSSLHQMAKVLEFQLQHQSFQWIFRTDFL